MNLAQVVSIWIVWICGGVSRTTVTQRCALLPARCWPESSLRVSRHFAAALGEHERIRTQRQRCRLGRSDLAMSISAASVLAWMYTLWECAPAHLDQSCTASNVPA